MDIDSPAGSLLRRLRNRTWRGVGIHAFFVVVDNNTPTAVADNAVTAENTAVRIPVLTNDSDPNGDPLTVTDPVVIDPANGVIVVNGDGTVTYTPDVDFTGIDTLTYEITDLDGNPDTAVVTVVVAAAPALLPSAAGDSAATPGGMAVDIPVQANDNDPLGQGLATDSATEPPHGAVVINGDGTVTYTPDVGFVGADTFTYTIVDGNAHPAIAAVTVTVSNNPPVAEDDAFTVAEDTDFSARCCELALARVSARCPMKAHTIQALRNSHWTSDVSS